MRNLFKKTKTVSKNSTIQKLDKNQLSKVIGGDGEADLNTRKNGELAKPIYDRSN